MMKKEMLCKEQEIERGMQKCPNLKELNEDGSYSRPFPFHKVTLEKNSLFPLEVGIVDIPKCRSEKQPKDKTAKGCILIVFSININIVIDII